MNGKGTSGTTAVRMWGGHCCAGLGRLLTFLWVPPSSSQLLSAVLLLLRLWGNGTREMDNERSTQGTSAPLLPLLQRFQSIHNNKEEPIPDDQPEVHGRQRVVSRSGCKVLFGFGRKHALSMNHPSLRNKLQRS